MLFREINRDATKKNVHGLLSAYRSLARIADEDYMPKMTSTYSFEPKSFTGRTSDPVGGALSMKQQAEDELESIIKAFNKLNAYQRQLLYFRYIDRQEKSDIQIYMDMNMSERTYYRELEKALMSFAEAYKNGRLLAEKWQTDGR